MRNAQYGNNKNPRFSGGSRGRRDETRRRKHLTICMRIFIEYSRDKPDETSKKGCEVGFGPSIRYRLPRIAADCYRLRKSLLARAIPLRSRKGIERVARAAKNKAKMKKRAYDMFARRQRYERWKMKKIGGTSISLPMNRHQRGDARTTRASRYASWLL